MRNLEPINGVPHRCIKRAHFLFDLTVTKRSFQEVFENRRGQTYIQSRCELLVRYQLLTVRF